MLPCAFPESNTTIKYGEGNVPCMAGIHEEVPFFITAWKPSFEDMIALQSGRPVMIRISGACLPHVVFTTDEFGMGNFDF